MDEGLLYVVWKKDKQIEDSRLRENEQGLRIGGGGFHVDIKALLYAPQTPCLFDQTLPHEADELQISATLAKRFFTAWNELRRPKMTKIRTW